MTQESSICLQVLGFPKDVLGVTSGRYWYQVVVFAFKDADCCESQISSHFSRFPLDSQDVVFFGSRNVRNMNVNRESCLLQSMGGDGHATSPEIMHQQS
jgi:hypothetical protein